ncbi:DUF2252 domain-containing protein [Nocardiopsis changdeensis]|uniref:DUF2252 domain-containing protein n=1 Tax=Nocardiopsis changdeensis TaxID=2831969 RepID=A0ABX8BN66_9ACTN|nr:MULTISPECIES: DUF2252 domain-containing protein [Nocardiopsis]QUX22739.1 DUF2252 domain-containing protein [Nocardiopsis changdeensis]QYX38682.1 DUF2252 domain-containing protein [Nocardiopsis sp. MT53]
MFDPHSPVDRSPGRRDLIVSVLEDAFADLMSAAPAAFRFKFRRMAADPFAFYRGSAALFYADVGGAEDPWADARTSRVWIQGDLHSENFGTYMDATGRFVFDVNDFDEAYPGHFTWDVLRLSASIALTAWRKALSDDDIDALVRRCVGSYVSQVAAFAQDGGDRDFSLKLGTTDGTVHDVLQRARSNSRSAMLLSMTRRQGYTRLFREGPKVRRLDDPERERVLAAYRAYLDTIPSDRRHGSLSYEVKDVVGSGGFGIGSAGLPAYTFLVEGPSEAWENDLVLSMKQGNVAAPSRVVRDPEIMDAFEHHGHRTAVSQRALQAHTDPLLGHTEMDGRGFVVSEVSPYTTDLDWDGLTEPADIAPVLEYLGRAAAKAHCVSDSHADDSLVDWQVEEALMNVLAGREAEFVDWCAAFAHAYAAQVRADHALFVDAFRNNAISGVRSSHG